MGGGEEEFQVEPGGLVLWLLHEDSEGAGTLQPRQTQEPRGSEEAVAGATMTARKNMFRLPSLQNFNPLYKTLAFHDTKAKPCYVMLL